MTQKEVEDSFIYKRWYYKKETSLTETDEYNLSVEYMDMTRWGFGEFFTFPNIEDLIMPIQFTSFYCINDEGYLKIFRKIIEHIDSLSLNDLLKTIEGLCKEFNLKFVALPSVKYSWDEIVEFLEEDLKLEYNEEGYVKLFI